MKKIFIILALSFLFFFLFIPNTFAKQIDYTDDKYLIDKYPNFYSNLDSTYINDLSNGFQLYWGQRTNEGYYNFNRWINELYPFSGGAIMFNGTQSTFYADNNNISSFIYGFEFNFPKFEANKKYQFDLIVSTSKEIDYNEIRKLTDNISILYLFNGSWSSDKSNFNYLRFGFYKEDNADSDALHYHFLFQISPKVDVVNLNFQFSSPDASVEDSNFFKFLDNKTNKDIAINVVQTRYFEVEEFDFSSGEIHDGGGITFDGERTDDSSFDNNYEVCDSLDFVCHFRNLKNWFLTLGRRISNGFESIINFFTSFIDTFVSFIDTMFSTKILGIDVFFKKLEELVQPSDDGITSIITAPLSYIKSLSNGSASCSSISLPLVSWFNKDLILPCPNTIYSKFGSFLTIYQTITTGIIAYWCLVNILSLTLQFKEPFSDKIEVMDL